MAINPLLTNVVNSWTTACTCTWLYIYAQTIAGSMHPVSAGHDSCRNRDRLNRYSIEQQACTDLVRDFSLASSPPTFPDTLRYPGTASAKRLYLPSPMHSMSLRE